jgi:hypothetical protein
MKYASVLFALGCLVTAVNAQWLETTIQLDSGAAARAICHNPADNKVYGVDYGSNAVAGIAAGQSGGLRGSGPTAKGSRSALMFDDDVGLEWPGPAWDVYMSIGDTFFPRCQVENYGRRAQTNVPVSCVIRDTATGAVVFAQTVYVASLDSGQVQTVEFKTAWVPPSVPRFYLDTMATALPGDEDSTNDRQRRRITVLDWGAGHLTYNDGTFEDGYSWVSAGNEFAVRFASPERPLQVNKVVLWNASFGGGDYPAEVRVYGPDGTPHGYPGTELGVWAGSLHTDALYFFHMNEIYFDPPVVVDFDTFFVSCYQTSIAPPYPYLAADTTAPFTVGNDWGRYGDAWGRFSLDGQLDFGIDVCVGAVGIAENPGPQASGRKPEPTVLSPSSVWSLESSAVFDAMGRRVLSPKSGVYFVRDAGRTRKVVIQR